MVTLELDDAAATELEYAIKFRISSITSVSVGCPDCIYQRRLTHKYCDFHANMVAILEVTLMRLQSLGFNLLS